MMLSAFRVSKFTLIVILLTTLLTTIPAVAEAILSEIFPISADDSLDESTPAIAYNPDREEYLVVWMNESTKNFIQAQRLDKYGNKIGDLLDIANADGHHMLFPDVAYNTQHKQYLVVWEDLDKIKWRGDIYARRISPTGTLMDTFDILVAGNDSNLDAYTPAVAYSSVSDRYMLVWAEYNISTANRTIYTQKMTDEGYYDGSADPLITPSTEDLGKIDIAYNPSIDRHLVVWEEFSNVDHVHNIVGMQVHGDGGTYSTKFTIDSYPNESSLPAVAAISNPLGDIKFLVVHQYEWKLHDNDIHGTFIEENGGINTIVFPANTTNDESMPAVAGSEGAGKYLVVWRETFGIGDYRIRGRFFDANGDPLDDIYELNGMYAAEGAIAAGDKGDFLIAWQDYPAGQMDRDIFGAILGLQNYIYIPLVNR